MKTFFAAAGVVALILAISGAFLVLSAPKWYQKAAEQGNADAQLMLGVMYRNGRGVLQSEAKAAQWFQKAAEQGNADAQLMLGVMHLIGQALNSNQQAGCNFLRASAEQGRTDALDLYNDFCVTEKADPSRDELEKRLNDTIRAWSNRIKQKTSQTAPPLTDFMLRRQY